MSEKNNYHFLKLLENPAKSSSKTRENPGAQSAALTHALDKSGSSCSAANMVVAEEGGNDVVNDRTAHNVVDNPPESVASEQGLSTANGAQRKQKTFKH